MRRLFLSSVLLLSTAGLAFAQAPQGAKPVSDAPPKMVTLEEGLEPQVTIRKREGDTMEEHRVNGKLYKVVVTPEHGVPYTLVDPEGSGSFVSSTGPGDPNLSVPMWTIGSF